MHRAFSDNILEALREYPIWPQEVEELLFCTDIEAVPHTSKLGMKSIKLCSPHSNQVAGVIFSDYHFVAYRKNASSISINLVPIIEIGSFGEFYNMNKHTVFFYEHKYPGNIRLKGKHPFEGTEIMIYNMYHDDPIIGISANGKFRTVSKKADKKWIINHIQDQFEKHAGLYEFHLFK